MPIQIGKRMKQLRLDLGLSQEDVARRAGYNDRSVIAKFESGRSVPDAKLPDIAKALETTPAYLLGTLRDILTEQGVLVSEDADGNAELTDTKTNTTVLYPRFQWVKLQAGNNVLSIYEDLTASSKTYAQLPPDLKALEDVEIHPVAPQEHLKQTVLGGLIPAGTGMQSYRRFEHSTPHLPLIRLDPELIDRLSQLTPEELARVDAFVQGILAARE